MIPRARPNYGLRALLRAFFLPRESGRHCDQVREYLSAFFPGQYCVLAPSGRAALYILMKALPGDNVVAPAYTCSAVVEAARLAGKNIAYADNPVGEFNVAPSEIQPLLNPGTIFVATHQYGMSCDASKMARLCAAAGCTMVEDIAAALGTETPEGRAGEFGVAAFGSFDTTKLVHAPMKGGFIITRDAALAARCEIIRDSEFPTMPLLEKLRLLMMAACLVLVTRSPLYPVFHFLNFTARGQHTAETGAPSAKKTEYYKYRFSDWQAAVVLPQLRKLPQLIERRRQLYADLLRSLTGLKAFVLPQDDPSRQWACVRFPILVRGDKMLYYKRGLRLAVDMGFSFSSLATPRGHDAAWAVADKVLNLPFYDRLSPRELERMIAALKRLENLDA